MIKHRCRSCGGLDDVVSADNGYCVTCLSLIRRYRDMSHETMKIKFMEANGGKMLTCATCGDVKTMKEALESAWELTKTKQMVCRKCLNSTKKNQGASTP